MYAKLGYELVERKDISDELRDELLKQTEKAKQAQLNIKERK
jgi:hypothetical protein